ncbi:MAG TPA: DNA-directed RNA polymerase subunit alpha [Thermoanaerobaculia bacterium]|nr:DNA-directed RNA polymerase subunit alpha [Thermoanaerobaculia bacterium]
MNSRGFQQPKRVEIDHETLSPTYGRFTAQPFERGFATTVGNALRRCLLSSIEGAAITAVHIEGVLHEFSSIPGVVEDVTDIILNLKQVPILLHGDEPKVLVIDVDGDGAVTAGQMTEDPMLEVVDKDVHIATLNEEGRLKLQALVKHGRGYVAADRNSDESMGIGWIPVDSAHSPVRRVNYKIEAARVGQATDYERLILEVWTNGTVSPEAAVAMAAGLLQEHLAIFGEEEGMRRDEGVGEEEAGLDSLLGKGIDELNLSVRSANSLKNANIHTLRDLVRRSERDMLETKNFGRKSLEEVQEVLERLGLSLGMNVPERAGAGASA